MSQRVSLGAVTRLALTGHTSYTYLSYYTHTRTCSHIPQYPLPPIHWQGEGWLDTRLASALALIVSGTRPSEKGKEGLGNRLGRKCTLRNVFISVNYLPANAGLEDFYRPHSACTLISGKSVI